ncbi:hypothetical protein F5148DRAFT_1171670 [Russula earlei]|uniref:Uncharacterized protein n=1 Tax=Russula earlei TaxID=71964 RepID=A0ACC0UJN2_9AGAM|nr:hypothetical protein F5148DRAFT_1171670 [Russula earlei]
MLYQRSGELCLYPLSHDGFRASVQSDSPYKGGTFYFKLALPEDFPFKPPTVW